MDRKLLAILACPVCKADLHYDQKAQELICFKCKLAYAIDNDIPIMLSEMARKIDD